jgi:hypothetical protein
MEKVNDIEKEYEKIFLRLEEKKNNSSKVVNRYLRMRLKRRIRYFTGIKLK